MNLAIASPSASSYSESFIHMQFEKIPNVMRVHGMPVPTETVPGGEISVRNLRGTIETMYLRGLRGRDQYEPKRAVLLRRLRRKKVSMILANFGPMAVSLLPMCREMKLPLVVHFHGYDAHLSEVLKRYREDYRELGREAAAIIVVSHRMREAVLKLGFPESKIRLIRYGIDVGKFKQKSFFPEDPLFFGIGRFVDKKAPYLTLLSFKNALPSIPKARLILAGDGPLLETTRNLAKAWGLQDSVDFVGIVPHSEVSDYMHKATAFVQHSLTPMYGPTAGDSEGTPVSILEAMVSGLPVISTLHAGIGEINENGRTALLVEERDTDAMTAAMVRLATCQTDAREIGANARASALDKFTSDHYIAALTEILDEAFAGAAGT